MQLFTVILDLFQIWTSAVLTPIPVTSMQIVQIPWAHILVRAELDIQETDKLAMVRRKTETYINDYSKKWLSKTLHFHTVSSISRLFVTLPIFTCVDGLRKHVLVAKSILRAELGYVIAVCALCTVNLYSRLLH